ncbi:MAG: hypothetical protein PHV13_00645 [Candidatus ainarchaeum sp.]|nr:hypothetical protein [Candidatus ainarchaeum sp.]
MNPPAANLQQRVVVEVCHKDRPFCPFAKRNPLPDGIRYERIHVGPFHIPGMGSTGDGDFFSAGRIFQFPLVSLGSHSVHELYLSEVPTNPFLDSSLFSLLVSEAHRVLDPSGTLVLFNGYFNSPSKIIIDFSAGCAGLPKFQRSKGAPKELLISGIAEAGNFIDMVDRLNEHFRPLTLPEHTKFLMERDLGPATELQPGDQISVLAAKH